MLSTSVKLSLKISIAKPVTNSSKVLESSRVTPDRLKKTSIDCIHEHNYLDKVVVVPQIAW